MRRIFIIAMLSLIINAPCFHSYAQTSAKQIKGETFPSIVEKIKRGLAFVEVGTNFTNSIFGGTAFLMACDTGIAILVTCRHIFYETGNYKDTIVVADLNKINITFHYGNQPIKAHLFKEDKAHDVALLAVFIDKSLKDSLKLTPIEAAGADEIFEGIEIACTGYNLALDTLAFGKHYRWASTHRGIISCNNLIGPSDTNLFVQQFRTDMILNRGMSGGPIYFASDGRVIGMAKGGYGFDDPKMGLRGYLPFGESDCIPLWTVIKQIIAFSAEVMAEKSKLQSK